MSGPSPSPTSGSSRSLPDPGSCLDQANHLTLRAATPSLVEGGREFCTVDGAFAARDVLSSFGGGRVVIGVTSTPFKCPPAAAGRPEFGTSRIRGWFGQKWSAY